MGHFHNPLLPGCHPDPSICRAGDSYYLVTSTFEYLPGLPIHRSSNLVDWELVGHAVTDQLDFTGVASSRGLYAPTLRYHRGTFYVVCTMVPGPDGPARSGHFLVTATDPAGPWSQPTWFASLEGIDPSLVFDDDGRVWLTGTRLAEPGAWEGQCDVWLTELDPATYEPIGPLHLLWRGALQGAGWAEGPHLYPRPGGGWMLLAAEGGTDRDHAVSVAYADQITGPYRGDPGNPRLTHRHLGNTAPIANVGHADLVQTPDGRWWSVMLATHQRAGVNSLCGRQTHLVPVQWENGRPIFTPGSGGLVLAEMDCAGLPDQQPPLVYLRDEFEAPVLDGAWNAVRWLPEAFTSLLLRPGWLRLQATPTEPWEVGHTAFVGRRLPSDTVRVRLRAQLRSPAGAAPDPEALLRGGLLLRTAEAGMLEVAAHADGSVVVVLVDGETHTEVGRGSEDPAAPLELTIELDGATATAYAGATRLGSTPIGPLRTGRPGWFVGSWVGPFVVGSGQLDVDWVEFTQQTV